MKAAGLTVELLETRHVRDAFKSMPVKTDRKDARGIAQLMRLGWFRPVHCKTAAAHEVRALLTARKLVQSKLYDVEMSRARSCAVLKVGPTTVALCRAHPRTGGRSCDAGGDRRSAARGACGPRARTLGA
jgi:transposase